MDEHNVRILILNCCSLGEAKIVKSLFFLTVSATWVREPEDNYGLWNGTCYNGMVGMLDRNVSNVWLRFRYNFLTQTNGYNRTLL